MKSVVTWDVDGDVSIAVIQMVTREQSTSSPDEDQQEAAESRDLHLKWLHRETNDY